MAGKKTVQQKAPVPDRVRSALPTPQYLQPLIHFPKGFPLYQVLPEKSKQLDFNKVKEQIESKNRSFSSLILFDLKLFLLSVFHLVLVNLLIFRTVSPPFI